MQRYATEAEQSQTEASNAMGTLTHARTHVCTRTHKGPFSDGCVKWTENSQIVAKHRSKARIVLLPPHPLPSLAPVTVVCARGGELMISPTPMTDGMMHAHSQRTVNRGESV